MENLEYISISNIRVEYGMEIFHHCGLPEPFLSFEATLYLVSRMSYGEYLKSISNKLEIFRNILKIFQCLGQW